MCTDANIFCNKKVRISFMRLSDYFLIYVDRYFEMDLMFRRQLGLLIQLLRSLLLIRGYVVLCRAKT